MARLLRLTSSLRYRHHPLDTRGVYPPAADKLCSQTTVMGGLLLGQSRTPDICLELVGQSQVNIGMEVKTPNLSFLRNKQWPVTCPEEDIPGCITQGEIQKMSTQIMIQEFYLAKSDGYFMKWEYWAVHSPETCELLLWKSKEWWYYRNYSRNSFEARNMR